MNETIIEKALTQAPSLVVLVVVVWMFLRFMERMNVSLQTMMRELAAQHMDAREQSRITIAENSRTMRDFIEAQGKLND